MSLAHSRRGTGEPLLLVHGVGSEGQVWAPLLTRLAAVREVVTVDLPGHGSSPPLPTGERPDAPRLARAVAELLDELGWERPHVGGNSLGGWVALELAKLGRARSVTCLSPAGFWSPGERRYARATLRACGLGARRGRAVLPLVMATAAGRTAAIGWLVGRPWRMPPAVALRMSENLARSEGFEATVAAIHEQAFGGGEEVDVPVTIAWGARDRLLFPRQSRRAVAAVPEARRVVLPGCGHVPTWDDPELVANTLLEGSAVRGGGAAAG